MPAAERRVGGCALDCVLLLAALKKVIRAADAKEVGVGNPAEETYRYPNQTYRILDIIHKMSTPKTRLIWFKNQARISSAKPFTNLTVSTT